MVSHVSWSDIVMEEIKDWSVWSVDSMESSFDVIEFLWVKIRNIDVSVLEPGVEDQPKVCHEVWQTVH